MKDPKVTVLEAEIAGAMAEAFRGLALSSRALHQLSSMYPGSKKLCDEKMSRIRKALVSLVTTSGNRFKKKEAA